MIRLPAKITKNKKSRSIPLSQQVLDVLDGLSRYSHDFVVTDRKKPIASEDWMKKKMKKACEKAMLPYGEKGNGMLFKDLRRSAKTNMLKVGIKKEYRDLILGHALGGMDEYYISERGLLTEFKQAMETYSAWLAGQMEKTNVAQSVAQT
jgi:integrase